MGDGVVVDVFDVFDEGAEAVAVGGDEEAFAAAEGWGEFVMPAGEDAVEGVVEGFGVGGEVEGGGFGVAGVEAGVCGVVGVEGRWGDVVGSAPDVDLSVAVLGGGFGFVEALECAVVALVEAPASLDGEPGGVEFVEDDPEGVDGALEDGGPGAVELDAGGGESSAGFAGFLDAVVAEVDVDPAGEAVLAVPVALSVAEEDEVGVEVEGWAHGCRVSGGWRLFGVRVRRC